MEEYQDSDSFALAEEDVDLDEENEERSWKRE